MTTDSKDPRVAVVMITWNRREEVLRSLGELRRLPERPRVVLVDNGSRDGTARAVNEHFPEVEVVCAGRNLGAAARTLGARRIAEPYAAFCDDDTWWEPGSLRRAADLFDRCPKLGVANARVLVEPGAVEDPICQELERSPLPREAGMPGPPLLGFLAGSSVVRRSAFLEAGGFEPRLFVGGEEELLAADLAARGWWMCYVPELVVHHQPSQRRDSHSRHWHVVRNALWSAWLRRPLASAVRKTVWMVRSQPWSAAPVRGFAAAVAGLPWVLRHRRVVPDAVERSFRLLDPPQMYPHGSRRAAR